MHFPGKGHELLPALGVFKVMCQDLKINVYLVFNTPFKYTTTGTTTEVTGSLPLFLFTCEQKSN